MLNRWGRAGAQAISNAAFLSAGYPESNTVVGQQRGQRGGPRSGALCGIKTVLGPERDLDLLILVQSRCLSRCLFYSFPYWRWLSREPSAHSGRRHIMHTRSSDVTWFIHRSPSARSSHAPITWTHHIQKLGPYEELGLVDVTGAKKPGLSCYHPAVAGATAVTENERLQL